jgi:hypothetical protein
MIHLSQKSLLKKPLDFKDGRLEQATVFPMFSSAGRVDFLVVVDHREGLVYRLRWSKGLFTKPWFSSLRVDCTRCRMEEVSLEDAYELTNYWHFDPWWLLKEEPFVEQSITSPLKATNTVGQAPAVTAVWFARDLSAVRSVVYEPDSSTLQIVPLLDGMLPEREPLSLPRRSRQPGPSGQWRLVPFWESRIGA